jgi:hypothetical protein
MSRLSAAEVDGAHRGIIRDDGENDIRSSGDVRQLRAGLAAEFGGEIARGLRMFTSSTAVTLYPHSLRRRAMLAPIFPTPTKATV